MAARERIADTAASRFVQSDAALFARNAKLGEIARRWETDLGQLDDMSSVCAAIVEDALSGDHERVTRLPDTYFLTKDQVRNMLFCVYQAQRMISQFRESYHSALEAA